MRIEWLIGERQFRLDTSDRTIEMSASSHDKFRIIEAPEDGFVLTIPEQAKVWITKGVDNG